MLRWLRVLLVFCLLGFGSAIAQDGSARIKPWAERLGEAGVVEPVLSKIHSNDPRGGDSSQGQVLRDVDNFLLNGSLSDAPIYQFQSPLFAEYKSRWRSMQANGKLPEAFCENFVEYTQLHDVIPLGEQFTAAVNARAHHFGAEDLAATRIILAQVANSSDRSEAEIAHGGFASNQYFSLVETVDGLVEISGEMGAGIDADSSLAKLPLSRMATNLASLVEDRHRNAELHTALEKMCVTGWLRVKNDHGINVEEELKADLEVDTWRFPDYEVTIYNHGIPIEKTYNSLDEMTTQAGFYRDVFGLSTNVVESEFLHNYQRICADIIVDDKWPGADQLRHLTQVLRDDVKFLTGINQFKFSFEGVLLDIRLRTITETQILIRNSLVKYVSLARSNFRELWIVNSLVCDTLYLKFAEFENAPNFEWSVFYKNIEMPSVSLKNGISISHSFVGMDTHYTLEKSEYGEWQNRTPISAEGGYLVMSEVKSGGTISLNDVYISGNLQLGNARGDVLRLQNVRIEKDVNFWGAQFSGPVFLGYPNRVSSRGKTTARRGISIDGHIHGTYFRGADVQITNAFVGKTMGFNNSTISGSLHISNTYSESIKAIGAEIGAGMTVWHSYSDLVDIRDTSVAGKVTFGHVQLDKIYLVGSQLGSLVLYGPRRVHPPQKLIGDDDPQDLSIYRWYKGMEEFNDIDDKTCKYVWRFRTATATGLVDYNRRHLGIDAGGCVGWIFASKLRVENSFEVNTHIENKIDLRAAQVGGIVDFSSQGATFSEETCANLNFLRAESILLSSSARKVFPDFLMSPKRVALFGVDVRTIGSENTIAIGDQNAEFIGEYLSRFATASSCEPIEQSEVNTTSGFLESFFGAKEVANLSATGTSYNPSAFDALAKGFDNVGYASLARFVRIEKNWSFAKSQWENRDNSSNFVDYAVLASTVGVYHLAGWISGFGYDNVRALLIYLIIVVIGALLYAWRAGKGVPVCPPERQRASTLRRPPTNRFKQTVFANAAFKRVNARLAKMEKSAQGQNFDHQHGTLVSKLLYGLWYSIDRSLPPLYVDSRFDTHQNLEPFLAHWFYFQRVVCFVLTLFFVAGAFNLFQ